MSGDGRWITDPASPAPPVSGSLLGESPAVHAPARGPSPVATACGLARDEARMTANPQAVTCLDCRDLAERDAAPVTTLTVDLGGARMIRVSGDRGDVLCLTHCGTYSDVAALQEHAGRLAEVLGCLVAIFADGIEPAALPAQANLGIATTGELLDELRARLEVDAAAGVVSRADYRTSTGQPVGEPAPVAHPLGALAEVLRDAR